MQYAASRGGRCLSTRYVNSYAHLSWQCERGHVWNAAFASVKSRDSWCRCCASVMPDIAVTKRLAHSRGGNLACLVRLTLPRGLWHILLAAMILSVLDLVALNARCNPHGIQACSQNYLLMSCNNADLASADESHQFVAVACAYLMCLAVRMQMHRRCLQKQVREAYVAVL